MGKIALKKKKLESNRPNTLAQRKFRSKKTRETEGKGIKACGGLDEERWGRDLKTGGGGT